MNTTQYLCHVAYKARSLRSNYVVLVKNDRVVGRGRNLRDALTAEARGATLYTFSEPSWDEVSLAAEAGIDRIYYAVSNWDLARHGLYPDSLNPRPVRYSRDIVIKQYLETWDEEETIQSAARS